MSGYPGDVIGEHGVLASGTFVQKLFTPSGLAEKVREVFATAWRSRSPCRESPLRPKIMAYNAGAMGGGSR
jgi:hypothetical protein